MISRSGTRKSSDANVLAVKQGFDFRAAVRRFFGSLPTSATKDGFSEVFRLPLRKMVFRKSSDFRYERWFLGSLPTSATKDGFSEVFRSSDTKNVGNDKGKSPMFTQRDRATRRKAAFDLHLLIDAVEVDGEQRTESSVGREIWILAVTSGTSDRLEAFIL